VHFLPQLFEFVERLKSLDPSVGRYSDVVLARAFFGLFMSYAITVTILGGTPEFRDDPKDLSAFADIFLYGVLQAGGPAASPAVRSTGPLSAEGERVDP
jgi:hypothetical protein